MPRKLTSTRVRKASREAAARPDLEVTVRVRAGDGRLRLVVIEPDGFEVVNAPMADAEWWRVVEAVGRHFGRGCKG